MAYEMVHPSTNLSWFRPDSSGVSDDDLMEVTLDDESRLYFRFGKMHIGNTWFLDQALIPRTFLHFMKSGTWYVSPLRNSIHVGSRVVLYHTLSGKLGCGSFEFDSLDNHVQSMQPIRRPEAHQAYSINGVIWSWGILREHQQAIPTSSNPY